MGETANQPAIIEGIKILVDGALDIKKELAPGQSLLQRIEDLGNLIPDVVAELKDAGDLGAEIKALTPADIPALVAVVAGDLGLEDPHAQLIVQAALKVLQDIPDVVALINAIENKTPSPAPGIPPVGGIVPPAGG
jgi:hypothetical protein